MKGENKMLRIFKRRKKAELKWYRITFIDEDDNTCEKIIDSIGKTNFIMSCQCFGCPILNVEEIESL